jgi:RNA polymerase sigma-70 factor (ECF subfamily)
MEDIRIIELFFSRDEEAIIQTDVKYGKLCYQISRNILSNRADCEECVNDTYLGAWNAIPPARPENFMAYLCKITRNLALKKLRFLAAAKRAPGAVTVFSELESELPDADELDASENEELGRLISKFLRGMDEAARNVFIRRYFHFESLGEISLRYGFSESKVKSMLYSTRIKLRKYLIGEGVEI